MQHEYFHSRYAEKQNVYSNPSVVMAKGSHFTWSREVSTAELAAVPHFTSFSSAMLANWLATVERKAVVVCSDAFQASLKSAFERKVTKFTYALGLQASSMSFSSLTAMFNPATDDLRKRALEETRIYSRCVGKKLGWPGQQRHSKGLGGGGGLNVPVPPMPALIIQSVEAAASSRMRSRTMARSEMKVEASITAIVCALAVPDSHILVPRRGHQSHGVCVDLMMEVF